MPDRQKNRLSVLPGLLGTLGSLVLLAQGAGIL